MHLKRKISVIVWKTLWGKEKLLVTSNFSFSHNVFHSYISLECQNGALCGKGLTLSKTSPGFYVSAVQVFWKQLEKEKLLIISPCPTVFSTRLENSLPFSTDLKCRLQTLSVWKSLNFVDWESFKWHWIGFHRQKLLIGEQGLKSKIRLCICAGWSCSAFFAK